MARQSDGLYKRCTCGARTWTRCHHGWHFDYYHSRRDDDQKRVRLSLASYSDTPLTRDEAITLRDKLRAQIREGTFVHPRTPPAPPPPAPAATLTVTDLIGYYTTAHVNLPTRRPAARKMMTMHLGIIERTEIPVAHGQPMKFGDLPTTEVTTAHVNALREARRALVRAKVPKTHMWPEDVAARRESGMYGEVGHNRLLARLRHLFSWAIKNGYIDRTPFKRNGESVISLVTETSRERRLEGDECERLLKHAGAHLYAVLVALVRTGCRVGELLGLQFSQIVYSAPDANGDRTPLAITLPAKKTKTGKPRRIPVSADLRAVLVMRETAPDGKKHPDSAYVFGDACGERVKRIDTAWHATCRRAGITEKLDIHDFRREFGSRLLESGAPLHEARDLLGHADISQTSEYLKASLSKMEESIERMANASPIVTPPPDVTIAPTPKSTTDSPSKSLPN